MPPTIATPSGAKPIRTKVVWVLVQLIPLVGTMAYFILVHRTLLQAENRVRRS
jgi:hypothetical protein